jgi:hypothetical protein
MRQALPEWVYALQILLDKLFIDHRYTYACRRILIGERATLQDLDAESLEVFWRARLERSPGALRKINDWLVDNGERHAGACSKQGLPVTIAEEKFPVEHRYDRESGDNSVRFRASSLYAGGAARVAVATPSAAQFFRYCL